MKYDKATTDRILELYRQIGKGCRVYDKIQDRLQSELGITASSEYLRKLIKQLLKRKSTDPAEIVKTKTLYTESVEIHPDGRQTSDKLLEINADQAKSPNYMMQAHGYDIKLWELVSCRNNIWNAYSKQDGIQVLYSSKITVKPRTDTISMDEIREHFNSFSRAYTAPAILLQKSNAKRQYMLELPIVDLHLGKLGWAPESGEHYDHKIAEARFLGAIQDIIDSTRAYPIERIVFPVGNDFFHIDTICGTTTAGTQQDTDLRWQKVYLKGIELLVCGVDMLRQIAPVELMEVEGNHDRMTCYYAILYIAAWFRGEESVIVKTDPFPRKYVEYGQNLIGYTHGSEEGKRINNIMQVEAREAWGRTRYHEWHLGHLHSEKLSGEDIAGINIRHISSVCGPDAWHARSGYVGSVRKAQAFVWHKEHGLKAIINSVII
jgi:hypothetical protein